MGGGKCRSKLCPMSFGLALGLAAGLAYFFCMLWAVYYGPTAMMTQYNIPVPTIAEASVHALWTLLKGFVFGFFVALFYDIISCCCKKRCCRCACCDNNNCGNKTEVK